MKSIMTISMDPEVKEAIEKKAKILGQTYSAFIRVACLSYPDSELSKESERIEVEREKLRKVSFRDVNTPKNIIISAANNPNERDIVAKFIKWLRKTMTEEQLNSATNSATHEEI